MNMSGTLLAEQDSTGSAMKRTFDVFISAIALLVLMPLLLLVSLLILLTMGWPVLFLQKRTGLHGKPFRICKFRTMRNENPDIVDTATDGGRLTRLGRILRSTSLDELPELLNVLRGDMSLVGPRPLLPEYLDLYNDTQARRHEVRPGITGWAQVNGRNAMDWESRFKHDVWYVDNRSFFLDVKIILSTFVQVFRFSQVSQPGHATQEKFKGSGS